MIDDILLKSVTNKRWARKLFLESCTGELQSKYNFLLNNIENMSSVGQLYNQDYQLKTSIIVFIDKEPTTVYIKDFIQQAIKMSGIKDPEQALKEVCLNDLSTKLSGIPSLSKLAGKPSIVFGKGFRIDDEKMSIYDVIQMDIDLESMNFTIGGISFIKSNKTTLSNDRMIKVEGFDDISFKAFKNKIDDIFSKAEKNKASIENVEKAIKGTTRVYKKSELDIADAVNITRDEVGKVNIQGTKHFPFIYTNQLIKDDRARSMQDNCDSLISNIRQMKKLVTDVSLYTTSSAAVLEGRRPLTPEEIAQRELDNKAMMDKKIKLMLDNKEDNIQMNTLHLLNAYEDSIKLACNGIFNKDFKDSAGLEESLQIYDPEIQSPFVIAHMEGDWESTVGDDAKSVFRETFGINGNVIPPQNCLMGYYTSMSEPLFDAFIIIRASSRDNWRILNISVKAGRLGKGAAASIASIKGLIYNYQGNGTARAKYSDTNWSLTHLGSLLKVGFPMEFELLDLLTSRSYKDLRDKPQTVVNILGLPHMPRVTGKNDEDEKDKIMGVLFDYINRNTNLANLILKCLRATSFEAIQVNATPKISDKGLHFTWSAKYPATYRGIVNIEVPASKSGFTKFHIL